MISNRPDTDYEREAVGCEYCGYMRSGGIATTCTCPECLQHGWYYLLLGAAEMRWRAAQWAEQGEKFQGLARQRLQYAKRLEGL